MTGSCVSEMNFLPLLWLYSDFLKSNLQFIRTERIKKKKRKKTITAVTLPNNKAAGKNNLSTYYFHITPNSIV